MLRGIQAGADVERLLAARRGKDTAALLPTSLDGLYGMIYGLLAPSTHEPRMSRALDIIEQLPDIRSGAALPIREAQTLAMELTMQKTLDRGLEATILDSASCQRYAAQRRRDAADA